MASTTQSAVSIIIPVYNVEQYLQRCLKSVQKQTLTNIEIICINDGSTDNSGNIIQKFASADNRFKVITQENQGLSASRNNGINAASGEYIFFLDSDDYLHPQALEIFYKTALRSNAPVVISKCFEKKHTAALQLKDFTCDTIPYRLCKTPLNDLYKHRFVSAVVWNKLYKTELIKRFHFIEGIYFEDWPFTACIFADISCFALIKEKLYIYNKISPSIVRSQFSTKKIHDYIYGIRYVYNYFRNQGRMKEWEIIRKRRITSSLKMILSKIAKSLENRSELEAYFKQEYTKLAAEKIIFFSELSLKSKFRLLRLMWHQRHN